MYDTDLTYSDTTVQQLNVDRFTLRMIPFHDLDGIPHLVRHGRGKLIDGLFCEKWGDDAPMNLMLRGVADGDDRAGHSKTLIRVGGFVVL